METKVVKKAIINTVAASGTNVLDVAASGVYPGCTVVCVLNSVTPPVELLPPITKGTCKWATKTISQAEVRQIALVGMETETIIASTRYKIELGNPYSKYESHTQPLGIYAYTSPSVLSGTAATDLLNVYTALVNKINNDTRNNVTAYLLYKVAFTSGGNGGSAEIPIIGNTYDQETSLATVTLAGVTITGGSINGGNATGFVWLYNLSGTWSASSKTLTGATSAADQNVTFTTAAALTHTGLVIVDDAGYFPAYPNLRKGISQVEVTSGFTTAVVDVGVRSTDVVISSDTVGDALRGRAGRYAIGIGSRMLTDVPVWNLTKDDVIQGNAEFQVGSAPDSTKTYSLFRFGVDVHPTDNVLTHYGANGEFIYELWAAEDAGRTNIDAMETALESSLGVTIA